MADLSPLTGSLIAFYWPLLLACAAALLIAPLEKKKPRHRAEALIGAAVLLISNVVFLVMITWRGHRAPNTVEVWWLLWLFVFLPISFVCALAVVCFVDRKYDFTSSTS